LTAALAAPQRSQPPWASLVVPVYNEVASLGELFRRITATLGGRNPYEIVFVDDGSTDGSLAELRRLHDQDPGAVTIVVLARNFGQHAAILAGLAHMRGAVAVTLDADLQNPPEEVPALLAAVERGHDVVGGVRVRRHDPAARRWLSRQSNRLTHVLTGLRLADQGCMLRAYSREIARQVVTASRRVTFVPALGWALAANPTEVPVAHASRREGRSKYGMGRLLRLDWMLLTRFCRLSPAVCAGLAAGSAGLSVLLGRGASGLRLLAAVASAILGLALALFAAAAARARRPTPARPPYVVAEVVHAR
jgi:undecaprenyl-phosphate 4-deoxy-4-formamido-L-arabinose transferase